MGSYYCGCYVCDKSICNGGNETRSISIMFKFEFGCTWTEGLHIR